MKYICNLCNYETLRKGNFESHMTSMRHAQINTGVEIEGLDEIKKRSDLKTFVCKKCNSKYSQAAGLSRHKKSCQGKINIVEKDNKKKDIKNIVTEKDNKDKDKIIELEKKLFEKELALMTTKIKSLEREKELLEQTKNDKIESLERLKTEAFNTLYAENEYHKKLINHSGNIVNNSMNTLTYLIKNHKTKER